MEPYIFILIINSILSYIANICYNKKYKLASAISLSILVLVNVVFSGCRDFGVGIDTTVYIDSYFNAAQSLGSVKDFFEFDGDKGFLLLACLASLFSDESQSLLIVTEMFIQTFFYLALWQYKKVENISMFVATALFCIMFYCHTLNLMRQFCAISMLAFAFSLFIQGKKISYVILQVLAFFFHSTSLVFIFVPILWNMSKMKDVRKRNIYSALLVILLLVFVSFYFSFLTMLGSLDVVSDVYFDRYGENSEFMRKSGYGLMNIFSLIYPVAFVVYAKVKKVTGNEALFFMLLLSISVSIFLLLAFKITFVDRISFYLSFIMFIFLPKIFSSNKMNVAIKIVMFILYFSNWYSGYIVHHGGDIYPYKSKILNVR